MSDWPWEIPESWTWVSAGDVSTVVGGGTPPTNEPKNYEGGEIPWITPADLSGYSDKFISRGARNITQTGLDNSGARLMPAGTVLFSSRAPIGYVAIAANEISTNQGFKSFVLPTGILPSYWYWYLKGAKHLAIELASGTTFLEISGKSAAQVPVPLAPEAEQRRIVDSIEALVADLDAAVAALRRVQANLKRYRGSVLKAACEGRLVPTEAELARQEGRSYETGEQLLARILKGRRAKWEADQLAKMLAAGKPPENDDWKKKYKEPTPPDTTTLPELPEGWTWARWEQVGFSQNGRPFPSAEYQDEGVRLLRPGNLFENGKVEWTRQNTRCLPAKWESQNQDLVVGPGELVMNLTAQSLKDEFLGRICMTQADEHCLLNQRLARLRPVVVSNNFVLWLMKSRVFRRFVDTLNTGSLIQHMFTTQLADFVLPLPPLSEQERIVEAVEQRVSTVLAQEDSLTSALARADRLRQAILKQAFGGKLVPQDPSDEPASSLLERIRADRVSAKPVVKRSRRKMSKEESGVSA